MQVSIAAMAHPNGFHWARLAALVGGPRGHARDPLGGVALLIVNDAVEGAEREVHSPGLKRCLDGPQCPALLAKSRDGLQGLLLGLHRHQDRGPYGPT